MTQRYRKQSKSLIEREIDDECVIVNTRSGNVHQLNPVAACIWCNLEDDMDLSSIAEILCEKFEVDMETALRDAEACLKALCNLGLVDVC